MTIEELTREIKRFVRERDWEQFHNPKDMAIAVSIEASELLEHFLWQNGEEVGRRAAERQEKLSHEIADIAIYLFEMADLLGIDLGDAILKKLRLNGIKYPVDKAKGSSRKYNELDQS